SPEQVRQFDRWLANLARRCAADDIALQPGAGAAGGLGFAMMAFFGATLRQGAQIVIESVRLHQRLAGADLCITGEGRFDASSLSGKAPTRVAQLCKELNVPCVAVVGSFDPSVDLSCFTQIIQIQDRADSEDQSKLEAERLIAEAAAEIVIREAFA
ncbi:MAG: glycerate kinase, partial [Phycisphaerales bacterium]|nr:glycerate kinase [Phycisphaerales bacterium]